MKKAILIDIDGTICDSRVPLSYLNGEKDTNNFEVYYRLLDKVEPIFSIIQEIHNNILKILESTNESITLVFLTGRTAESHAMLYTMNFIEKYFEKLIIDPYVQFDFYFRPTNLHGSSLDYKIQKFEMLKHMYYFLHIYEDEPSNVEMFNLYKQQDCVVHWVKNLHDYSLEEQKNIDTSNILIHTTCL